MKKSYIAPSIKVESAKLAAFCSGNCSMTEETLAFMLGSPNLNLEDVMTEGVCYCYHSTSGATFSLHAS